MGTAKTTTTALPAAVGAGRSSRKRSRSLRVTSAGGARSHATLRTTEGRTRRARNAQSAASTARIRTPRVVASVSPKILLLVLLLPPPPQILPLPNRGQRGGRPRGLLRHMLSSEPTWVPLRCSNYGATPGGYTLPFCWSNSPFFSVFYVSRSGASP